MTDATAPGDAGVTHDRATARTATPGSTTPRLARRLVAEAIGTFALVFAGTGAIVVDDVSGGVISHVGIALTFGLVVMAMIYAVGDVSGAHFNPAVTLGFWTAHRLPSREVGPYIGSQCAGALLASAVLRGLFVAHPTLGATVPAGAPPASFLLEVILTFFLVFVILGVTTGTTGKGFAGIAIGATVGLGALFGGPVSGASMNPARSLGPAMIIGDLGHLWLYFLAPLAGAWVAVQACRCVHAPDCCRAPS